MSEKLEIETRLSLSLSDEPMSSKWVPVDALKRKLQELFDTIPIEMQKVGRRYEVFSIGTKKQWLQWFMRYNELFSLLDGAKE